MSLSRRVLLFFLTALAVVLAGFSVTLYLLARAHLHRQADDRVRAGLDALAAAAEVEPGGVEWDPRNRALVLAGHREEGPVRWQVRGPGGEVLGQSADPDRYAPLPAFDPGESGPFRYTDPDGRSWVVAVRRVEGGGQPPPDPQHHPYLTLTAAAPLRVVADTLERLALALVTVSVGVWLVALAGGRWVCRRALRPVAAMAADARAMTADDFAGRLPVPATGDELAALGSAYNGLLDRLREAYERQRRFTGDASHQLRTPLAGLLGQVEVCLRHPREAGEYRRVLTAVRARGEHLRQIVDSLLYLARADADAALTDLEPIDLGEWVDGHLKGWATHPRAADIRVEGAGPAVVRAQAPLLGQLLDNLLDNALKYGPAGSPVVVRVTGGERVTLAVEDRGAGIAADELLHVFEPFYRSAAARSAGRPGVGLGLAVARRIAAAFGAAITAASTPGRGSRFAVTFPAASPAPPPG